MARTIVYSHGNTRPYLHLPEGKPSISLLEMANPELREALATALYEAAQEQRQVIREGLRIKHNGGTQFVRLIVRPVSRTDRHMIITFEEIARQRRRRKQGRDPGRATLPRTGAGASSHQGDLARHHRATGDGQRRTEAASTRSMFQPTKSSRSANEELETSREELRSVNEELVTINTESRKEESKNSPP